MKVGRRRHSDGPVIAIVVVVVAILGGAGIAWFLQSRGGPEPVASPALPVAVEDSVVVQPDVPPLELPELAASDAFVRDVIGALSEHPRFAAWLINDDLIHRFVGVVVDLAGGRTPTERLAFMAPAGDFEVRETDAGLVIDPASYGRYDLLTGTFLSLDTEGSAILYHQLYPLFEEAFAELGIPNWTFAEAMSRATQNLLAAPATIGNLAVRPNRTVYEFVDPDLESRSAAEKQLIRMGPENARRFQDKLRDLMDAISVAASPPSSSEDPS